MSFTIGRSITSFGDWSWASASAYNNQWLHCWTISVDSKYRTSAYKLTDLVCKFSKGRYTDGPWTYRYQSTGAWANTTNTNIDIYLGIDCYTSNWTYIKTFYTTVNKITTMDRPYEYWDGVYYRRPQDSYFGNYTFTINSLKYNIGDYSLNNVAYMAIYVQSAYHDDSNVLCSNAWNDASIFPSINWYPQVYVDYNVTTLKATKGTGISKVTVADKENENTVTINQPCSIAATIKTGYHFVNWTWTSGGTAQSSTTNPLSFTPTSGEQITFAANGEANTYQVIYNVNSGTGSMSNSQFTYDTAGNLRSNTFTKSGYVFNGWNTKADGTGTSYSNGGQVLNLTSENNGTVTLYAQWKFNSATNLFSEGKVVGQSCKVTWTANDNNITYRVRFIYNDFVYTSDFLSTTSFTGYTFDYDTWVSKFVDVNQLTLTVQLLQYINEQLISDSLTTTMVLSLPTGPNTLYNPVITIGGYNVNNVVNAVINPVNLQQITITGINITCKPGAHIKSITYYQESFFDILSKEKWEPTTTSIFTDNFTDTTITQKNNFSQVITLNAFNPSLLYRIIVQVMDTRGFSNFASIFIHGQKWEDSQVYVKDITADNYTTTYTEWYRQLYKITNELNTFTPPAESTFTNKLATKQDLISLVNKIISAKSVYRNYTNIKWLDEFNNLVNIDNNKLIDYYTRETISMQLGYMQERNYKVANSYDS